MLPWKCGAIQTRFNGRLGVETEAPINSDDRRQLRYKYAYTDFLDKTHIQTAQAPFTLRTNAGQKRDEGFRDNSETIIPHPFTLRTLNVG